MSEPELDEFQKSLLEWIEEFRGFMVTRFYILDGTEPVPVRSITEMAEWREANAEKCQIDFDERDGVQVSTVFLGIDHGHWRGGPPVLFETMVFGGEHDGDRGRFCTYDAAVEGHRLMVEHVWGPEAHVLEAEFLS
jgi:hypothetical protein